MSNEKAKSMFDDSLEKIIESLPELHDEETKGAKFHVIMTHPSGADFHAGVCFCRDENGKLGWRRCRDCRD